MASPRLAAFCCPKQDAGSRLLLAMPPRAFHALRLACGALSLAMRLRGPPQRSAGDLEPSPSLSPTHILRHAATCDTLGCLGLVLQSAVWLGFPGAMPGLVEDGETWAGVGPTAFCVASALWIQLFYAACFYWLFCYALDSYLVVRRSSGVSTILVYRLMSWGLAGLLCAEGALVLYSPSLSRCEGSTMQVLPLHLATYLPLLLAMLGIPVLRRGTLSAVDSAIKGGQGVYTARERKAQALVGRRLLRPGVVLGACWGCNLLNEGLLLYLDTQPSLGERAHRGLRQAATTTWVMAGILNPAQGFLLSLAMQEWTLSCCLASPLGPLPWGAEEEEEEEEQGGLPPAPTNALPAPSEGDLSSCPGFKPSALDSHTTSHTQEGN